MRLDILVLTGLVLALMLPAGAVSADEEDPYVVYSYVTINVTDSSHAILPSVFPPFTETELLVCFNPVPETIRVTLEWDDALPASDLEFGLEYPSGPAMVRGGSPLVWRHLLADEDENCAKLHLRADTEGVNVHVEREVTLEFARAYNGATLP